MTLLYIIVIGVFRKINILGELLEAALECKIFAQL